MAIVGIYDGPKIAIIFIGTFFQQVLVVSNTTRGLDRALVEAAQTLGSRKAATADEGCLARDFARPVS